MTIPGGKGGTGGGGDSGDNNGKVSPLTDVDLVLEEADWVSKLKDGLLTVQEEEKFQQWLNSNPGSAEKIDDCLDIWALTSELKENPEIMALCYQDRLGGVAETASERRKRYTRYGVAAALLLSLSALGIWFGNSGEFTTQDTFAYRTIVGQQLIRQLPDGTRLHLNTDSRIEVTYSQDQRALHLVQGEVALDVARDPTRPFDVYAGIGRIRVLGTRFNVFNNNGEVTVTLEEGSVQVVGNFVPEQRAEQSSSRLNPGQAITYSNLGMTGNIKPADLRRLNAWREGRLEFKDQPLAEVVAEVNRYSKKMWVIGDERLNSIKVSGVFAFSKLDEMLDGLAAIFSVETVVKEDEIILLASRDED